MLSGSAQFIRKSANEKLAPVERVPYGGPGDRLYRPVPKGPFCCATSVSVQATCSNACPFKRHNGEGRGCFADSGFTRIQQARMDAGAQGMSGVAVALEEVRLMDAVFPHGVPQDGARGGRDLRLHVGGDAKDTLSAALLSGATERWKERGGGSVWTFTHSWREVPRSAWGPISVLASVESPQQAMGAVRRGYAPALVVDDFPNGRRAFDIGKGLKAIPCPAETRGLTCVECRLCLDRDLLSLQRAIAFKAHGRERDRVLAALRRVA